jgi:hypothetical protein
MFRLLISTGTWILLCCLTLGCSGKAEKTSEVPDDDTPPPKVQLKDKDHNTTATDPLPPPPLGPK